MIESKIERVGSDILIVVVSKCPLRWSIDSNVVLYFSL